MRWNCKSSMFAGVAMMLVCCVCMMGCASLGAAQSPPGLTHLSAAQFDQDNYRAPLVEIQINSPTDVIELDADPFNQPGLQLEKQPVFDNRPVFDDRPVIHSGKFVMNTLYHPSNDAVTSSRTVVRTSPVSHRVYTRSSCQTVACRTKTVSRVRHYRVQLRSSCCN
jgi:hypothetical protein